MRGIISLDGKITGEDLIQRIAESDRTEQADIFSEEDNALFVKRHRLCELLNDIDFTVESYGIINFFGEYEDQIDDLKELGSLLSELGDESTPRAIHKSLLFYERRKDAFAELRQLNDNYNSLHSSLQEEYRNLSGNGNFYIPFDKSIKILANFIKNNHHEFFTVINS